jgi:hypothetical protein
MKKVEVMLVFKEGVKGFIYDSIDGSIVKVFNEELSEDKIEMINEVIDEDSVFISDEDILNMLFEIESKEDFDKDIELVDVCDFKD